MRALAPRVPAAALLASAIHGLAPTAAAQDIEPRAYSNAPVGVNFLIAGYGYAEGGVASDPSLLARVLGCLARQGRPVELVSHGPGDVGLSCVVPEEVRGPALAALHEAFFPASEPVADPAH